MIGRDYYYDLPVNTCKYWLARVR